MLNTERDVPNDAQATDIGRYRGRSRTKARGQPTLAIAYVVTIEIKAEEGYLGCYSFSLSPQRLATRMFHEDHHVHKSSIQSMA